MHIKLQCPKLSVIPLEWVKDALAILSEMVIVTCRYWPGLEEATPEDPETTAFGSIEFGEMEHKLHW
jgi:hypothetical protein